MRRLSSALSPQPLPGFEKKFLNPQSQIANPKSAIQQRLRAATRPAFIQVAPGKFVPASPPGDGASAVEDNITLARWKPNGDGTYSPLPYSEPMVRVDSKLIKLLGFRGNWQTLARLGRAGFIEMVRLAPATTLLNLNSYFNHLARCAEDPEFWDEGKGNLKEYRKSI